MSALQKRSYVNSKYHLKINNWIYYQKPVHSWEGKTVIKLYYEIRKKTIEKNKIQESGEIEFREKNRNSIENIKKLPQFTTMNVIDGQAGLVIYSSLIFYSLTIDNILNIVVLLILAGVSLTILTRRKWYTETS